MSDYNLGTASGKIEIDGRAAAVGFKVAETAAGAFFDVVKARVDQVQTLGKRMAAVGATASLSFGGAIKVAADFEQQMSGVNAVVNGTQQEMDALREKALQLGADTSFSASQAALAIEELAKAGIPVQDILNGAADGAVALAAAGGIGLAEAATISANAMNQFGLAADKIPEVADILAGVANTSAADVSSIGQSLSQAGAVANLAGLSFRDTAIAIGEMADAGINGSDAGTSLKTMLNNLIPVTEKQTNKFIDLGLLAVDNATKMKFFAKNGIEATGKSYQSTIADLEAYVVAEGDAKKGTARAAKMAQKMAMEMGILKNQFFNAKGEVKQLGGLQGTLAQALKGMTKEQKLSTLEVLFGADAMRATAILSLEGAAGYREFSKAVSETSAADVAKARLDNLSGAIEAFKGSMETAMITVGSVFLPAVTKMVQALTFLVNKFNELPNGVKIAIAVLGAVASAGLLVVGMILALLPLIVSMVANFLLMRGVAAVTAALRAFYGAARAGTGVMAAASAANTAFMTSATNTARRTAFATKALYAMSRAIFVVGTALKAALLNPYTIALLALVAIGILLYKKFEPFRQLVDRIAAALKDKLGQAWTALQPVIAAALEKLQEFGNFVKANLLPVVKTIAKELLGKLLKAGQQIADAFQSQLMPALRELGALFTGTVLPALKKAGEFMVPIIGFVLKLYGALAGFLIKAWMTLGGILIKYVLPILLKIGAFLGGVLVDTIVSGVKGIIQAVKGIIQIFSGLIDFFAGVFTGDWGRMWDGIKQIFEGAFNLIVGALKTYLAVGMLKIVGLGFKLLVNLVKLGWRLILNLFKLSGKLILNAVKLPFKLIFNVIKLYVRLWMTIIRTAFNLIRRIITTVLNFVRGLVQRVFNGIRNTITNVMNGVKGFIGGVWNSIKTAATTGVNGIKTAIETAWANVTTFFQGVPGKILTAIGDLSRVLWDAGVKLIEGFIGGIGSMFGKVGSKLGELTNKLTSWKGPPKKDKVILTSAGRMVIEGFVRGLEKTYPQVEGSLNALTKSISNYSADLNGSATMVAVGSASSAVGMGRTTNVGTAGVRPVRRKRKNSPTSRGPQRLEGYMDIRNGRAYVSGIAEEVVNSDKSFQARSGRRNRGDE